MSISSNFDIFFSGKVLNIKKQPHVIYICYVVIIIHQKMLNMKHNAYY